MITKIYGVWENSSFGGFYLSKFTHKTKTKIKQNCETFERKKKENMNIEEHPKTRMKNEKKMLHKNIRILNRNPQKQHPFKWSPKNQQKA